MNTIDDNLTPADPKASALHMRVVRLLGLAAKFGDTQRWILELTQDVVSGRVPDWARARAELEADLAERLIDIDRHIHLPWPH